jgi:hypothetical protein
MKKLGYILLPVFVFAFAAQADAQKVDTHQDRGETLKVTVTGQVNFDGIFRAEELVSARGGESGGSEWTMEGYIRLRLDVELSEKINAVISLRNQRIDGGATNHIGDNPEETGVIFDEASITLNELFNPAIKLTVGIVPVAFDLRGRGSAFFFDPAHSNSFAKNATPLLTVIGAEDELQPAGVHGVYSKDAFSLGVFLLPAIIEGGAATNDESAYGVWFMYALDSLGKGSRIGAIFAIDALAGDEATVFTIGAGIDWHGLTEGLELYAEIYFQFGEVAEDVDAEGWALSLGGEFRFPNNENNIWLGLNLTWVAGSDDADEVGFLSYENVNDLKIVEDQWFGFDLDTNYFSLKIMAGLAFTVGSGAMKNNLELSLILGINALAEDVTTLTGGDTDEIGHELDVNARLWASKQLSFHTTFGFLFSSEVLEDVLGNEDDSTFLWVLGADLKI